MLDDIEGAYISVERFQSLTDPRKMNRPGFTGG